MRRQLERVFVNAKARQGRGRTRDWKASSHADRHQFKKHQIPYFSYLHHMLTELKGSRTLRDIFLLDATRYGTRHWRGRLAQQWAIRYELSGGDLVATWFDCCDSDTLALIGSAQNQGELALLAAFRQVAEVLETKKKIRQAVLYVAGPGLVSFVILSAMLAAVPLFTVPQVFAAFGDLPEDYLGVFSRGLLLFADYLSRFGVWLWLGAIVALGMIRFSFTRLTGAVRNALENVQPWRGYRTYQGFRVFALLCALLRAQTGTQRLSTSLSAIQPGANQWLSWRLHELRQRLRDGEPAHSAFSHGVLSRSESWYFGDITAAQGLEEAFAATALHLQEQLLQSLSRYGQILKWCLLVGSVFALLGLGLWHFVAIDELRSGLLLFYSS